MFSLFSSVFWIVWNNAVLMLTFFVFTNNKNIGYLPEWVRIYCSFDYPSISLILAIVTFRRRQWQPSPVLLPGKSHGRRSLVGCGPWGREGSDMTERLPFHFSLSCTGEGNGNPLQCSCLENPRDEGAWWAALYGVAQSLARLKWLSSSIVTFYLLC